MPNQTRVVAPGPGPRLVRFEDGTAVAPPDDWALLPPGDAGLTRRVKKAGPTWTVKEKRGRRVFSKGVWAPRVHIEDAKSTLDAERETPAYQKRQAAAAKRRDRAQSDFVDSFRAGVLTFLNFHQRYAAIAAALADIVTAHATPVGSGTVARTQRIPVERRAEAAVIAWLRHQTTAYEKLQIARVKGSRREVRSQLARESRMLLNRYRDGGEVDAECPLRAALKKAGADI